MYMGPWVRFSGSMFFPQLEWEDRFLRVAPFPWGPWRTLDEWNDIFSCEGEC
jgi:hypothetical protein